MKRFHHGGTTTLVGLKMGTIIVWDQLYESCAKLWPWEHDDDLHSGISLAERELTNLQC